MVLSTYLNQNASYVALPHSKSNQVKVATNKTTQKVLVTLHHQK